MTSAPPGHRFAEGPTKGPSALSKLLRGLNAVRKQQKFVIGYIEHVSDGIVRGWAWDASKPNEHMGLDVFVRGVFAGCARTGRFRQDLLDNGIGSGSHVFIFHIPQMLRGKDIGLDDVDVFANENNVTRLGKVTSAGTSSPPTPGTGTALAPHVFFRGLIARIGAAPLPVEQSHSGSRRQIDRLLASAQEGWLSAFAAHIAAKYARPLPQDTDTEFWSWYLNDYVVEKGAARAPLSATDIEKLSALRRIRTQTLLPIDAGRLSDRYDWAIDAARRLFVEDCLVEPRDIEALRHVPLIGRRGAFPLSRFMIRFRKRHALLRERSVTTPQDRMRIYALIMMLALWDVHYLAYLPSLWLHAMLQGDAGQSPFVHAQKALLGPAPVLEAQPFIDHVRHLGFDIESQSFIGSMYNGARVLGGAHVLDADRPVDVQLIGPFRRSLGLAESCRRIAAALQRTGIPTNFVDFDIGTASSKSSPDIPLGQVRGARLNILHVNAEEAPEAIACLPDCFSQSHTILLPYWELNRPARAHELGLALVDEIWAPSRYLAASFAQCGRPVTHIGMSTDGRAEVSYVEGRRALSALGLPSEGFVFLVTFDALSWVQRKNALGAIEAFRSAFESGGASLVIKTRNTNAALSLTQRKGWETIRSRCEPSSQIVLLDTDLSARQHAAIVAGCDCLVSLHRAEGLGLDLLDALAHGTPVVATAYSGNMDFCDPETAWLVDYKLVPVPAEDYTFVEPGHVWADPDPASAIAALRGVCHDEMRRAQRAETARQRMSNWWSPETFATRLADEIKARLGSRKL